MTKAKAIDAEVHAHAQQLLKFCRQHRVGFVIAILDGDESMHEAHNLSQRGRALVARAMVDGADEETFSKHRPGASS
jgi:hypothetical protein